MRIRTIRGNSVSREKKRNVGSEVILYLINTRKRRNEKIACTDGGLFAEVPESDAVDTGVRLRCVPRLHANITGHIVVHSATCEQFK